MDMRRSLHKWWCEQQELGARAYETRAQINKITEIDKGSLSM